MGFSSALSLFALVTLGSVDEGFNPVFGATLTFALTVVALFLLIVLLYSTIDQMRPVQIIETIHDHALRAHERVRPLMGKTRRESRGAGGDLPAVRAERHGFVTHIDVDAIRGCLGAGSTTGSEVILAVSIG